MPQTHAAALIELKLGRSLEKYVRNRQDEGLSWRRIAQEIKRDTGISISHETLRSWFQQDAA